MLLRPYEDWITRLTTVGLALCIMLPVSAQSTSADGLNDALIHGELLVPNTKDKVSVIVFEDLECPSCARAYPLIHEALKLYGVHLTRYDYPLPKHTWAFDAAVIARYIDKTTGAGLSEDYRRDIFLAQWKIDSRDDLAAFSQRWFVSHRLIVPVAFDPSGSAAAHIKADIDLGNRVGLVRTPTVIVVTPNGWTQVINVSRLGEVLRESFSESNLRNQKHATVSIK